jgi:nucleoside phosphorylase
MPIEKKRSSDSEGPVRKKIKRSAKNFKIASSNENATSAPSAQPREIRPEEVTVAIFCALIEEAVAMELSFDEELECRTSNERYTYTFGCIGEHPTVIAQPNDVGTVNASNLAAYVSHDFRNLRFALMVGVGGGIPSKENDIRLGDIAVSKAKSGHPAVLPYDFVKYEMDNKRILKGTLNKPHPILQSADIQVQKDEILDRSQLQANLDFIKKKNHRYRHPETIDTLYDSTFCHVEVGKDCSACEKSSSKKTVERSEIREGPRVHRGLILSGNGVVKDPNERHRLCLDYHEALCFEMEAAGIMDEIPCLVIRGICDYCDTHKQDGWHYYASAVAAAYAKTILLKIHGRDAEKLECITDALEKGGLMSGPFMCATIFCDEN